MKPGTDVLEQLETVGAAWATYDLPEQERWDEYAQEPNYLRGQAYLHGERFLRKRCERTVERLRYQRAEGVAV